MDGHPSMPLTIDNNNRPVDDSSNTNNPQLRVHNDDPPRQHEENNDNATRVTSTTETSSNPPPRAIGPFAAMVDAFISSFRQASNTQNSVQAPSNHVQRSAPAELAPPLPQEPSTNATTITSETTTTDTTTATNATNSAETTPQSQLDSARTPFVAEVEAAATSSQQEPSPTSINAETSATAANSDTPRTLYFRMPFLTANGESATLAFSPGPIPVPPHQPPPRPPYAADRPTDLGAERGNGLASGFHLPSAPIFVPFGTSPLPFSFIFDVQTNTAWPIANVSNGPPGAMPNTNEEPGFAAGPPFHVGLNISFGPPPQVEQSDPERASRFVDSLERADAELRERMAKLGMGAIGDYGGRQDNEGGDGALGCGICLDEYPSEDRPEWIGGQASKDEEVVAVPCAGHHTLHRRCLYEWLAKTPPSDWTCPFCRAGLDRVKVESSAAGANVNRNEDSVKRAEQEAKARSLREEVRLREKARGWRCDSPACLLRYPSKDNNDTQSDELVSLLPCRHQLHLDCLCTSMRLEQIDAVDCEEGEEEDDEEEEKFISKEDRSSPGDLLIVDDLSAKNTVGKWVTCPTCRSEAWAELPMKRKRANRVTEKYEDLPTADQEESRTIMQSEKIMPISGARGKARLQDMKRSVRIEDGDDEDSDGAVESILS